MSGAALFPHLRPVAPGWAPTLFPAMPMVEPPPPWATGERDGTPAPVSAPVGATGPATPRGRRWCVRCAHCLDVAFVGERVRGGQCGACGGPVEEMGEVYGDRLGVTEHHCACDYRCTGAAGPRCDCHCGGANHGSGRTVEVVRDVGAAPRLRGQRDPGELRRRGDQFRAAVAAAEELAASLHPGSPAAWRLRRAVSACREGRTHARVAKLSALTATIRGKKES